MATKPDPTSRYARRDTGTARSMSEAFTQKGNIGEKTRQLSARIPESLHLDIHRYLVEERMSVQEFVRQAVTNELARRKHT